MAGRFDTAPGTLIEVVGPWSIVLNRNQNLLGRCMLVLTREETDVSHITNGEWVELREQIIRIKAALDSLFKPDHYNYAFLMNQDAQVHLHVIPRYQGYRGWDGKRFEDPDFGSMIRSRARLLEEPDLKRLTAEITAALSPKT